MSDKSKISHAAHRDIVESMKRLAARADRAVLEQYGTSVRGRELLCLIVSSPANLARLEEIRAKLGRHAPRDDFPDDLPLMVWMGFGIHGNEISGPDAALELARRLCKETSRDVLDLLDRLVVHIDVSANPDGR